jgi:hypothetical protein
MGLARVVEDRARDRVQGVGQLETGRGERVVEWIAAPLLYALAS